VTVAGVAAAAAAAATMIVAGITSAIRVHVITGWIADIVTTLFDWSPYALFLLNSVIDAFHEPFLAR
jgi:hypothetical protein